MKPLRSFVAVLIVAVVVLALVAAAPAQQAAQRWEYMSVLWGGGANGAPSSYTVDMGNESTETFQLEDGERLSVTDVLNRYGLSGWELVSALPLESPNGPTAPVLLYTLKRMQ